MITRFLSLAIAAIVAVAAISPCYAQEASPSAPPVPETEPTPYVVDVAAVEHAFRAPEEIPSGWITFRLSNEQGHEVHELDVSHLPEGTTYEEYVEGMLAPWETVWGQMQRGEVARTPADAYGAAGQLTPDWTRNIGYVIGRGLVSPGRSAESIVYLEPGRYVLDCWLKSPDGTLHYSQGMSREMIVTEEDAGAPEPEADYEIMLSGSEIVMGGELSPGGHTIAVHFDEDTTHDNVQLVRVDAETDLAEVADWMDWYSQGGLQAPAPAEFFGGVHAYGSVPRGNAAYFRVENVEPGRYAWIVEAPPEEEMWKVFTVE